MSLRTDEVSQANRRVHGFCNLAWRWRRNFEGQEPVVCDGLDGVLLSLGRSSDGNGVSNTESAGQGILVLCRWNWRERLSSRRHWRLWRCASGARCALRSVIPPKATSSHAKKREGVMLCVASLFDLDSGLGSESVSCVAWLACDWC